MKKLLIIALLFWGCETELTEPTLKNNVCVTHYTKGSSPPSESNPYNYICYSSITSEDICIEYANNIIQNSYEMNLTYYGDNWSCSAFCSWIEEDNIWGLENYVVMHNQKYDNDTCIETDIAEYLTGGD